MLELSTSMNGQSFTVHPVVVWDNDTVILIDTGYPGQLPQIKSEMDREGVPFSRLNKVVITHHDIDHMGSLASIVSDSEHPVQVLAYVEEQPYIQGDKLATKLAQLEANFSSLPEQMQSIYQMFKRFYANNQVTVNQALTDGEELTYCGGIKVIHTPGHTPGHICLYLKRSRILIAGDALKVEKGVLVRTQSSADYDPQLSKVSLRKLTEDEIAAVICYHGGLYQDNVNQRIAELAEE